MFASQEIEFLGFQLSAEGFRPGVSKTRAVDEFKAPKNVKEVRRFMGLVGFFRRFILKFAQLVRPITDLTKNDIAFKWGEADDTAFNTLKLSITSRLVLQ